MSLTTERSRSDIDSVAGPQRRSLNRQTAGAGKREVDLYVRTYTTLLESSGAIGVSSLDRRHLPPRHRFMPVRKSRRRT